MKKLTKYIAVVLAIIISMQSAMVVFASTKTTNIFNSNTYTHNSKFDGYTIEQGIDVSNHNGTIDWKKVKAAGVTFAFIRCAARGYADTGSKITDTEFTNNIKNAKANGIKVGVYVYSQAITTAEAKEEANWAVSAVEGYTLELPIVMDYEFVGISNARLDKAWNDGTLNKTKMTNNLLAFANVVKNAGYSPMVYASRSFLDSQLIPATITNNGIQTWVAEWNSSTSYTGDYNVWQFSSTGTVSGVNGKVDCNFMYINAEGAGTTTPTTNKEFTVSSVSDKTYTGSAIAPSVTVTYNGKTLTKDTDYTLTYSNNTNIGKATITVNGIGDYADFKSKSITFKIVPTKVTGLKLDSRGATSIKLKWSKNTTATGYEVQYKRGTSWISAGTTTNLYYTVKSLITAANQKFRVRAYKTVSGTKYYGAYSSEFQACTKPSKVSGFSSSRTTTTLTIKWTEQTYASYYKIYKYNSSKKSYVLYKTISGGANNSCKVTGLTKNSNYKFKVKAYKKAFDGTLLAGETSSVYSTYTAPSNTALSSLSAPKTKTITAKWSKKPGASGYQLMWSTSSDFSYNYKTVSVSGASTLSKNITTAQSKKKYYVRIRTYCTHGGKNYYSAWSKALSIKTK